MRCWNVGIVGGGPGGLMTAYALQRLADSPLKITLFEASHRLGGKILTPQFRAAPVRYEAGAAEFYDYSHFDEDSLKDLIEELGLPISPMGGPAVIMNDRTLANLDDLREQFGAPVHDAFRAFDRIAKDWMTPQEFYHSDHPEGAEVPAGISREAIASRFDALLAKVAEPRTRQFIENMIHSDLATEPNQTSPTYGLQNYVMNDPAYMNLYGIVGGNERLPQALAARIDADVRFEHRVQIIGKASGADNNRLRVHSWHKGQEIVDEFDAVVVALPHNYLDTLQFPEQRLAAAMADHHNYYNYPAHYLRISILFDRPFWNGSLTDSFWMLDRFGGCCLYDESSREPGHSHGVLGWLLGGSAANEMCALSDEELIARALDSLPQFLAHGREHFIEGRVHRWVKAVNAMPGGEVAKSLDCRHRPEPKEHPHFFLVGDYMFDSTLNGVLDSADYVAGWIAALMADNPLRG